MKKQIQKIIKETVANLQLGEVDFVVEYPNDLVHGDYASNVALVLSGANPASKQNPRQLAELIKSEIEKNLPNEIEKIEIAGPGFLNFFLSKNFFQKNIYLINTLDAHFGQNQNLQGREIIIDHTDPNPFKQFHIGHLMSNAIGEFISRIYEWNGANVHRFTYQGDVGPHVAKCIWGMKKMRDNFPLDTDSFEDKLNFIGSAYTLGANAYEDDSVAKAEIDEINRRVYNLFDHDKRNDDPEIEIYYSKGRKWSLQHFDQIYEKLGSSFERFIFETEVYKKGETLVRDNIGKVFELSDGAVIYRGEQDGLHTRVFINSQGLPTYEAKEMGLTLFKDKLVPNYHASIVITASEQKDYFRVVKTAFSKINPELANKTVHVTHGMMRFSDSKMSSRKGNVITGESLISDMEKLVSEKIADKNYSDAETIKSIIAVGAIKYSILKQGIGKDIVFDSEKSISFEGDSGPYIQYTYTRAKSVLEKAKSENLDFKETDTPPNWKTLELEKMLIRFPDIVEKAMLELAPQNIVTYLINTAGVFNNFYANTKILDGSPEVQYKLNLVRATMIVIRNGLQILGIRVPEKM